MDINDLRSITTVVSFALFLAIVWWAYGKSSKKGFEEAANLPFAEDEDGRSTSAETNQAQRKTS